MSPKPLSEYSKWCAVGSVRILRHPWAMAMPERFPDRFGRLSSAQATTGSLARRLQ
jgi:hypothetical protein